MRSNTAANLIANLEVRLSIASAECLRHAPQPHIVRHVVRNNETIMLSESRHREEKIRKALDGGVHIQVGCNRVLHREERLVPTLILIRAGCRNKVGGVNPCHLRCIRNTGLERFKRLIRVSRRHGRCEGRPFVNANALAPQFVGEVLARVGAPMAESARRVAYSQAAGHVNVAGDSHNGQDCMTSLHAVLVLVDCKTPLDAHRVVVRHDTSSSTNLFSRNPGLLLNELKRILVHTLCKLIKAIAPVLDEVMIIEILIDDDIQNTESQGGISARLKLQRHVALASTKPGNARIDADDLRSALHHVNQRVTEESVTIRPKRHLAPANDNLRKLIIRIVETIREVTGIKLRIACTKNVVSNRRTRTIARPTGLRIAKVRSIQYGERHRVVEHACFTTGTTINNDSLATILLLDVSNLFLDDLVGFVPRNLLPSISLTALFGVALHRIDDSLRIIRVILQRQTSRAKTALGDRMAFVTFNMNELTILDQKLDTTSNRMISRRGPCTSPEDSRAVRLGRLPLMVKLLLHFTPSSSFSSLRSMGVLQYRYPPSCVAVLSSNCMAR